MLQPKETFWTVKGGALFKSQHSALKRNRHLYKHLYCDIEMYIKHLARKMAEIMLLSLSLINFSLVFALTTTFGIYRFSRRDCLPVIINSVRKS